MAVEASDTIAQVLTKGQQGRKSQVCQVTAASGKSTPRADQDVVCLVVRSKSHRLPVVAGGRRLWIFHLSMVVLDHCPRHRSRHLSEVLGPLLLVWVLRSACMAYL